MAISNPDLDAIVQSAKALQRELDKSFSRIKHTDFNRDFFPILIGDHGLADLEPIVRFAGGPMRPIVVTDDNDVELYRVPAFWNSKNLTRVSTSRRDSISGRIDDASQRANSGTIPPGLSSQYVMNSITDLVKTVQISEEDVKAWELVLQWNGRGKADPAAVVKGKTNGETAVQLDGDYEDL